MRERHGISGLVRFISAALVPMGILLAMPKEAHAVTGLEACGNIDVTANANCQLMVKGPQCEAQCEDIRFEAACTAKLAVSCDGECNATLPQCNVDCNGGCAAKCTGGNFDCSADCNASCEGNCEADCRSRPNQTECKASCRATCSGSCNARCSGTPPSCQAKCEASCTAQCDTRANLDCQISCQARGEASCKAEFTGGCKAHCTKTDVETALFCDGQYVDYGNNLQDCLDALKAKFNITAQGEAYCAKNSCTVSGSASASCAAAPGGNPALPGSLLFVGLGAVGIGVARRRRNRV